jgi:hypothetical protein
MTLGWFDDNPGRTMLEQSYLALVHDIFISEIYVWALLFLLYSDMFIHKKYFITRSNSSICLFQILRY